jgi:hypothetical protein
MEQASDTCPLERSAFLFTNMGFLEYWAVHLLSRYAKRVVYTDEPSRNANKTVALGACVASLEGKTATNWSFRVIQATKIAPSVWPIVFSGVLGNAVRSFADWTVERGVSLLV